MCYQMIRIFYVKEYLHKITVIMEKKNVSFATNIYTIKYYEIDHETECNVKRGEGWQKTTDLITREFRIPIDQGGCGKNWNILERKLDEIYEPYWELIGQLWSSLYPGKKRLEEVTIYYSDSDSDSDSDIDSDCDCDM